MPNQHTVAKKQSLSPAVQEALKKGYEVTFEGEYYALATGDRAQGKVQKKYENVKVRLPSKALALNIFSNKIGLPAVQAKYPDALRLRTWYAVEFKPLDPKAKQAEADSITTMTKKELTQYIQDEELPVDAKLYKTVGALREAVGKAQTNPEKFEKKQEQYAAEIEQDELLKDLNQDIGL